MGVTFQASSSSAEAPDIEGGLYDARFEGVEAKVLEKSQFDPNAFIWTFTLFEDGKPVYMEGDPEPVTVDGVTSQSTNTRSKTTPRAVRYLKALMTADEFAAFEREEPFNAEDLLGRMVQVQVAIKDNGWPKVEDVLSARRARRRAAAAEAE